MWRTSLEENYYTNPRYKCNYKMAFLLWIDPRTVCRYYEGFGIADVRLVKTEGDQNNCFIAFYSSNHRHIYRCGYTRRWRWTRRFICRWRAAQVESTVLSTHIGIMEYWKNNYYLPHFETVSKTGQLYDLVCDYPYFSDSLT